MEISEVQNKILNLIKGKKPVFEGVENEWWTRDGKARVRRIVVVYNPRSSKAAVVRESVIEPLQKIKGVVFCKYEVKPTDVDDNASSLAKILIDGDIVITAGGDGTATIGLNGCMLSSKVVLFTALPFGNFNDMARTLKMASGKEIYPLEAKIDGKHYRFAACYFTIGMFAESTEIFDNEKTRKKLQKGNKGIIFSVKTLSKWYFKNKRKRFIPSFEIVSKRKILEKDGSYVVKTKKMSGKETKGISDYLAVNGLTVAKVMKGRKNLCFDKTSFWTATGKLNKFYRLIPFMIKSMLLKIPGEISEEDSIRFLNCKSVEIQAEGEYKKLENVKEIVISKSEKSIKIL